MAIVQFLNVSVRVRDAARSTRFYVDLLGCREVSRAAFSGATPALALPPTSFESVALERDGMRLELLSLAREPGSAGSGDTAPADATAHEAGPGLSHLTFAVDDLRSTLHSLRDRGVRVLDESLIEQASGVATCLVEDPDGLRVLLYERPVGTSTDELPLSPRVEPGPRSVPPSRPSR